MIRTAFAALLVSALAVAAPAALAQADFSTDPASAPAGTYRLDKQHASLTAKVSHLGMSYYTLRFDGLDGSYQYDPARPEATKLQVSIDPRSVDTGDPKFNQQIADQFFDATKYPEIRFVSTVVHSSGEGRGSVTGDLSFHGVTKPVTLDVVYNGGGQGQEHEQRMGFSATTVIRRSDFGVNNYLPMVGDDVSLLIEVEFSRT